MYVYCVYLAIFKKKYKTPAKTVTVLSVALHESGNINTLLGPWTNNTEDNLTPVISTQNHIIAW